MYINYHKHTDYSSITTPDTHIKIKDYFDRMLELGHMVYFTTEHGYGGDIFDPFIIRESDEKYKDIKICFGVEAYITIDEHGKTENRTRDNYHIVLLARTDGARKKLNKIISNANKNNFYYRPRINLSDFDVFEKDDLYITTACIGGLLRDDIGIEQILKPLAEKFKDNLFLEIQNHNDDMQKEINGKALEYSLKLNAGLIHANDSHYIYPKQHRDRLIYLYGSGITYDNEDSFILDYPDEDSIYERYEKQGMFHRDLIKEAMDNTLKFADCEEIKVDKRIKMPNLYKDLTPQQRMSKLENLVYEKWEQEKPKTKPWDREDIENGIELELDIVRDTNDVVHTADYFLLHEELIRKAKERGGILTQSARGSAGSFYVNYLLGLSGIDRFALDVPLYPTRFLSKSRLLETRSLADVDLNVTDQQPFIDATRDILGEHSCYPLIAYGTTKESGSFRNYCRYIEKNKNDEEKIIEIAERLQLSVEFLKTISYDVYNELAKEISKDGELKNKNTNWQKIFAESEKYVDTISSSSQHPCSVLLMEEDIESELGVIKIGDSFCVPITSYEVDYFKYLKSDFLLVSVVRVNNEVFKEIGKPIPTIAELIPLLDDKVWDIYAKGLTATINQVDSDFATNYVMKYKPRSYQDLSAFVASIRPGFKSLLEGFLNRENYSTGVETLDALLSDTGHYLLYQESIMKYLIWLGIPEDETYGLISKIAKKKLKQEEIDSLHNKLGANWLALNKTMDGFEESWQVVDDASKYSFNCSHSVSVAFDSLYGAYLKAHYPLEYFTVALNEFIDNSDKVESLLRELPKFGIKISSPKLSNPSGTFSYNRETNTIYQGIGSMKYISQSIGNTLKMISNFNHVSFIDLLYVMNEHGINKRQIEGLINASFFDEKFPNQRELLYLQELHDTHKKNKKLSKVKCESDDILQPMIKQFLEEGLITEQAKNYIVGDMREFLKLVEQKLDLPDLSLKEKIKGQIETLGSISLVIPELDKNYVVVKSLNKNYSPIFDAYCLANGNTAKLKVYKNPVRGGNVDNFKEKPFKDGDILYVGKFEKRRRSMFIDGEWRQIEPAEWEWWAKNYQVIEGEIV